MAVAAAGNVYRHEYEGFDTALIWHTVRHSLTDLRNAIKDKNAERVKKAMEELTKASHKLAEEIYKQSVAKQQSQGQQGPKPQAQEGPSAGGGKKDDIIDAEYKEEDDDGKKK